MSGHSKWSTIKRKKGAADAKRGKLFSKLTKEILIAAREGGSDPNGNIRLRNAILAARAANVPRDNIDRAVKKGAGELDGGAAWEEINYEGYGPAGVALIVEALTDNRNRTTAEIRHAFGKFGGNLGETGCVGWMFDRKGFFSFEKEGLDMEKFEEVAIESGADDIQDADDTVEVTCAMEDFGALQEAFKTAGFEADEAQLSQIPQTTVKLEGKHAETLLKLMETLEELDDVQDVYANFEMSDSDMEAMS